MTVSAGGLRRCRPALVMLTLPLFCCSKDAPTEPPAPGPIASITIRQPGLLTSVGMNVKLQVTARDAQGTGVSAQGLTWTSSSPTVATVSSTGVVTSVSEGTTTVAARSGGVSGEVTLAVEQRVESVALEKRSLIIEDVGQTLQLPLSVRDSAGSPVSRLVLNVGISDPTVASVSTEGVVTALAIGTARLTITLEDFLGTAGLSVGNSQDWSQVGAWEGFQGGPEHRGYVPINLDPYAFVEAWTTDLALPLFIGLNPIAFGDGRVYASTEAVGQVQTMWAFDDATGAEVWSRDFGYIGALHPPAFSDGRVYVQTGGHEDSFMWGLDASDGSVLFQTPYDNQIMVYYAPVILDGTIYVGAGELGGLCAFDALSGAEEWFVELPAWDRMAPAYRNGLLYLHLAMEGALPGALFAIDAGTGAIDHQLPDPNYGGVGFSFSSGPALGDDDDAYVTEDGRFVAFDLATRSVKFEKWDTHFHDTPAVANGVVYVPNERVLDAYDVETGEWLWRFDPGFPGGGYQAATNDRVTTSPLVTDNMVFIGTTGGTYGIHLGLREPVWHHEAAGPLSLSRDGLLVITEDRDLFAFRVR